MFVLMCPFIFLLCNFLYIMIDVCLLAKLYFSLTLFCCYYFDCLVSDFSDTVAKCRPSGYFSDCVESELVS